MAINTGGLVLFGKSERLFEHEGQEVPSESPETVERTLWATDWKGIATTVD
jgi:hypothetical protein